MRGVVNFRRVVLDSARWPNFAAFELACFEGNYPNRKPCRYCGGNYFHDESFLDKLQTLRNTSQQPARINSAHRCRRAEIRVGGVSGPHRTIAADLLLYGKDRHEYRAQAGEAGFTGFGLYRGMMHVDTGRARSWFGAGARGLWA